LPGFQVSPKKADVFYKTWSPVTIKLAGYAGKTITLEFTTNDCTQGGHFGYAYVDVNENCASPISGNVFCTGVTDSMSLVAPFGFQEYHWYNANFTTLLGTSNVLTLKPPPPVGTEYALEIVPYPGLGCLDTLRTVIKHSGTPFDLSVQSTVVSCGIAPIDLTAPAITAGSSAGLTFSYFTDLTQLNYLATPSYVTNSSTYYIKGVNSEGCNGIKPITTVIYQPINLNVEGSILACSPQTIDITKPAIVAGSEGGLIYSYWQDANTSLPLTNANAINTTGTYYIKATNAVGCDIVKPIYANVGLTPDFSVVNQTNCDEVDITGNSVTVLNTPNTNFSYWVDAAATVSITLPNAIKNSGIYYIKGEHTSTCSTTKPISVTVNPLPDFAIQQPVPVTYPSTIDLTAFVQSAASNLSFTYWKDAAATIPLNNATAVDSTNTYYVKAVAPTGCSLIKSVKVVVRGVVTLPPNAFSPNGDGVNDTWFIPSLKDYTNCKVEIFNRAGQLVYSSIGYNTPWDGKYNGKLLSVGTYYYIINLGMGKDYPNFNGSISLLY
jgi:gliding motility-associated-like protein